MQRVLAHHHALAPGMALRAVSAPASASSRVRLTAARRAGGRRLAVRTTYRPTRASADASEGQPTVTADVSKAADDVSVGSNGSGPVVAAEDKAEAKGGDKVEVEELPESELTYKEPTGMDKFLTSAKLSFALPWRRFKKGSVLVIELGGSLPEKVQGRFSPGTSLPVVCACLRKAALDPRINGIYIKISPLALGWGKMLEVRRHLEYFNQSGKWSVAYIERGGEKEYFMGTAATKLIVPPTAQLSLRGFSVSGTFLRGVLDKVGVQPQVKRIGEYKSAGDQLLREDMSDAQREQLTALLEDIYGMFCETVAKARGKTVDEVKALLDKGVYDTAEYLDGGWVDALQYEDEIQEQLKKDTGGKEDQVAQVALRKYAKVNAKAFVHGGAKNAIAVIRASGAILGGSGGTGDSISQDVVIRQLRAARENKRVKAVVLRVDSPGGDALSSDLMWREIQMLSEKKPVIASMSDVAASGGYYMAMACRKIVAEQLTITGSIGVVTGKFNLQEAYNKIGYNKVNISAGRYAEVLADNRPFTPEEQELFDKAAEFAYESFRDRAANSRGMPKEEMQKFAQGRIWSGSRAINIGLVDALGGINRAIQLAKQAAEIPQSERVMVYELSRGSPSPLALLRGGGASATVLLSLLAAAAGAGNGASASAGNAALGVGAGPLMALMQQAAASGLLAQAGDLAVSAQQLGSLDGRPQCLMPPVSVEAAGSTAAAASSGPGMGAGGLGLQPSPLGFLDALMGGSDGEVVAEWLEL